MTEQQELALYRVVFSLPHHQRRLALARKIIEQGGPLTPDYKEACDRLQTANLIKDEQLAATRHQKYKRCLAMASNCRLRARWFGDNAFYKKEQWALQWHKRWLELAEKFKQGLVVEVDKATGTDKTVVINYKEAK